MEKWGEIANQLGNELLRRQWTVTTAESCTAGGLAYALTEVSGSSAWFKQGIVCYADEVKERLLGVPKALLEQEGAVSEAVALRMAVQAAASASAELAIAITGVAGPSGGNNKTPVGCVFIAWHGPRGTLLKRFDFSGDRRAIREQAIEAALVGLANQLELQIP